jgi:hypothetical protein
LGFWDERNDLLRMPARYNMRIKNWRKMGRRSRYYSFFGEVERFLFRLIKVKNKITNDLISFKK